MSVPTSIIATVLLYLLIHAAAHLPRLMALVIASVTSSVLIRRKRRSERALINEATASVGDPWQRTTRAQRRLLRRALRDTMRLTVRRSHFPEVSSF